MGPGASAVLKSLEINEKTKTVTYTNRSDRKCKVTIRWVQGSGKTVSAVILNYGSPGAQRTWKAGELGWPPGGKGQLEISIVEMDGEAQRGAAEKFTDSGSVKVLSRTFICGTGPPPTTI